MPRISHPFLSVALSFTTLCIGGSLTVFAQQFVSAKNVTPLSANVSGIYGTADFNGDGHPDVLTGHNSSGKMELLLGDGKGNFTAKAASGLGLAGSVLIGDVNGDGKADVISVDTASSGEDAELVVYLNKGDGSFDALPSLSVGSYPSYALLLRDLNNDGKPDLIIDIFEDPFANLNIFQTFLNNGKGVFHAGSTIDDADNPLDLETAGKFYTHSATDLVLFTQTGFRVMKNDGHANFTAEALLAGPPALVAVSAGDLNSDGYDDLITTDGPAIEGGSGDGLSHVLINQRNGTFAHKATLDTSALALVSADIADLNHDGKMDAAFVSLSNDDATVVSVFAGRGDGTFGAANAHNLGSNSSSYVRADFNEDGNTDILLSSSGVPFVLATGDKYGNFSGPPVTFANYAVSLASSDLNGDGHADYVTVNQAKRSCNGSVKVFTANGKGGVGAAETYGIGQLSGMVAIGDVNGDGRPDIVVARISSAYISAGAYAANSKPLVHARKPVGAKAATATTVASQPLATANDDLTVLLGEGDGKFQAARNYKLLGQPSGTTNSHSFFMADTNHDGKLDLIGDWGVALGDGNGTFQKPIPFPSNIANIVAIGKADFHHDGGVDLAVATSNLNTGATYVYTLAGKGNGFFAIASTQEVEVNGVMGGLTTAQLESGGDVDLIFVVGTSAPGSTVNKLWVQAVNPNGTIASTTKYPTQNAILNGNPMSVRDYNQDGKLDVLVAGAGDVGQGALTLWLGEGNGKLSSSPRTSQGAVDFLTPVDLDGKNGLDLVGLVPNTYNTGAGIEFLLNTGIK